MLTKAGKLAHMFHTICLNDYITTIDPESSQEVERLDAIPEYRTGDIYYLHKAGNEAFFLSSRDNSVGPQGQYTQAGVIVGTGTGTITENDYDLFSQIDPTSITLNKNSFDIKSADDVITRTLELFVYNSSAQPITITEIGCVQIQNVYEAGSTSNKQKLFLLDHTLLDSPLTLAADGMGYITYNVSIDYTNFL